MNYTKQQLEKMMEENGGSLDLRDTQITALPDNLTVGGSLALSGTQITALPDNLTVGGSLYLRGTQITALPNNLTVGGSLDLRDTQITALPDNLTVGGWLDLRGTQITALPNNLTVGGSLDLIGTQITALPDNLTVGGSLDLRDTQITALPDNLTVGGWLDLSGTQITALPNNLTVGGSLDLRDKQIKIKERAKVKGFFEGEERPNAWLYCDDMLVHIKRKKKVGKYTYYVGKIPNMNVIYDGEHYAHCKDIKSGVLDLEFKKAKGRGADQYKNLTLESVLTYDEAVIAYRIITGACQAGTQHFLNGLKETKEKYTVAEIIELTKGQYGSATFKNFFEKKD
ncbi:MAG: hypothetical protein IJ308_08450 [Clostridia bacterium]|nr:hypothetical protein [Clostridia bacterium]